MPEAAIESRNVNAVIRLTVTILVALAFWSTGSGIAVAHTSLASSDPAENANVISAPTAITLTFTEDINAAFATVAVTSADGRSWASGDPQVEGPRVSAGIRSDLPATGTYTVGYRVVSADGHPVSGSYTFTIAGDPGETLPEPTGAEVAPSTAAAPPQSASPTGTDTKTSILTAGAIGLALGGAIAFWQSRRHRRKYADDADGSNAPARDGNKP
ncbi:copper resistance protein CopC [Mycobacterium sp. NPDC050041]|uniref:copper resistance protein CopC n=1 Tax=Mycobacterium sp. NPDC050041 TaxID=3364293 RepID=UPI003C2F95EE